MTLEMIFLTAIISFFINITTDMLSGLTLKIKQVVKEKPIEVMILIGILSLIYLDLK